MKQRNLHGYYSARNQRQQKLWATFDYIMRQQEIGLMHKTNPLKIWPFSPESHQSDRKIIACDIDQTADMQILFLNAYGIYA